MSSGCVIGSSVENGPVPILVYPDHVYVYLELWPEVGGELRLGTIN